MSRKIIAAALNYTDPGQSPQGQTLYVATEAWVTGSGDTPSNTFFQGRLSGNISFRRLVAAPYSGGRPVSGIGVLEISNSDGELDAAINWLWRDNTAIIKLLEPGDAWTAGVVLATAIIERVDLANLSILRVVLSDLVATLDQPLQQNTFSAGEAPEAENKIKPYSFGKPLTVDPVLGKASIREYWFHDVAESRIDTVYDNGASVAFAATTNGFTLNIAAAGKITADPDVRNFTTSPGTMGFTNLVKSITDKISGLTVHSASQTTINNLGYEYSYYVKSNKTANRVLFEACASHNGWFYINRAGELAFGRLQIPAASSVVTFTANEIIGISSVKPDYAIGLSNRMGAQRNWTAQSLDALDTGLGEATRVKLSEQYQYEALSTNTFAGVYSHANKGPLLPSYFVNTADADTESDRLTALYASKRLFYEVQVAFDINQFTLIEIGDTVTMEFERYGLGHFSTAFSTAFKQGSSDYLVLGIAGNFIGNVMTLSLWG